MTSLLLDNKSPSLSHQLKKTLYDLTRVSLPSYIKNRYHPDLISSPIHAIADTGLLSHPYIHTHLRAIALIVPLPFLIISHD